MKHAHKYQRFHFPNKREAWRCLKPACNHYKFKEFFLGSSAECWKCKREFVIDKIHLTRVKPCCLDCMPKKEPKAADALLMLMKKAK